MSRRSRKKEQAHNHSRRFIDDVTSEVGYTNNMRMDDKGRMVRPENYDPIPPNEIVIDIEYPAPPVNARPKPAERNGVYKDVYNFPSSYLDRLQYYPNGVLVGELNPDLVSIQLDDLQSWEELDVIWDAPSSQFTNSSWNQNINFVDNIFDDVYTFGDRIVRSDYDPLPGED